MFDIGSSELLLIVVVAVLVIGPKDLPRALYKVGQIVGKARGMAKHFRTGLDTMIREAELDEMEKKWAAENRRIMAEHPSAESDSAVLPASGDGYAEAPPNAIMSGDAAAAGDAYDPPAAEVTPAQPPVAEPPISETPAPQSSAPRPPLADRSPELPLGTPKADGTA